MLFVALLFGMPQLAPLFQWSFPGVTPPVFERGSFFALWLSHAGLVLVAGGAATIIGIAQSGWDSNDTASRALLETALLDY